MAVVAGVKQRTPEWHAARALSIGSSDLPVLVGLSSFKSEYELALEKAGQMPTEEAPAGGMDPREVGTLMEPVLLELYRRNTGRRARRVHRLIAHPDHPWATASLDAETIGETPNRDVELKHSYSIRWSQKTLPEEVEVQVMWQMGVSGYRAADVMALVYGVPRVVPVDFDESYFADLLAIATSFRERTAAGILPKPDGSESARHALSTRFPADDGTFLPTSLETAAIAAELRDAKGGFAAAKGRLGTAENAVRAVLGDATGMGALEADGYRITWKRTSDRTATDWKAYATELEQELAFLNDASRLATAGLITAPTYDLAEIRERHTATTPGGRRLLATFANATEEEPES
jgi:putative phage-type endonuclease